MKLLKEYKVLSTKNYGMFKNLIGNRDVREERKKRVSKSIEEVGLIPAPIIVNEKNEVIDGQGRLEVCREKNLPVYYMRISGLGLKECIAMNRNSSKWNNNDYIRSYAELGNSCYVTLDKFLRKYNPPLSFDVVTYALSGKSQSRQVVKEGLFKTDPKWLGEADALLKYVRDTLDGVQVSGRKQALEIALAWCYKQKDIDTIRLCNQFRNRSFTYMAYSKTSEWIKAIEDAYNYRLAVSKQIRISAWWELDRKEH